MPRVEGFVEVKTEQPAAVSTLYTLLSLVTLAESPRLGAFRQAMKEMNFKLIANFFSTTFPTNMSLGNAG